MKPEVKKNPDGSVTSTRRYLTKQIRDLLGKFHTMVSFDGVNWRDIEHQHEEQTRLGRVENLAVGRAVAKSGNKPGLDHPWNKNLIRVNARKAHDKKKKEEFEVRSAITGKPGVMRKTNVKKQHKRRNLRKRVPTTPNLMVSHIGIQRMQMTPRGKPKAKLAHQHTCRVHDGTFMCSCDQPKRSRRCGPDGKTCLYSLLMEGFAEMNDDTRP